MGYIQDEEGATLKWSPDTCGCSFEYDFEPSGRTRTGEQFKNVKVLRSCQRHPATGTPLESKMSAIMDNWLRNDVRRIISSVMGRESDQQFYLKIIDSFDLVGVLHIQVDDREATNQKLSEIRDACDLQLVGGRVVIDG